MQKHTYPRIGKTFTTIEMGLLVLKIGEKWLFGAKLGLESRK